MAKAAAVVAVADSAGSLHVCAQLIVKVCDVYFLRPTTYICRCPRALRIRRIDTARGPQINNASKVCNPKNTGVYCFCAAPSLAAAATTPLAGSSYDDFAMRERHSTNAVSVLRQRSNIYSCEIWLSRQSACFWNDSPHVSMALFSTVSAHSCTAAPSVRHFSGLSSPALQRRNASFAAVQCAPISLAAAYSTDDFADDITARSATRDCVRGTAV